jgi:hypothetical protein
MHARTILPAGLVALSRSQAGVLSRPQVRYFGVNDRVVARLVRDGYWRVASRGIYALGPDCFLQRAWAGLLVGGSRSVLGRQAAGFLHGVMPEPERLCVFVGEDRRIKREDPPWEFVRARRTGSGEPIRTRLDQTLVDLAPVLDADQLASLVAKAMASRRVTASGVLALLEDYPRLSNRQTLMELVGGHSSGLHSPLEVRYERDVERAHGLPAAARQVSLLDARRSDGVYELYGLIIELDGLAYHLDKVADMERDNEHLMVGFRTLRFGWSHVTRRPCWVAAQVATALRQGGWTGRARSCPRCRTN